MRRRVLPQSKSPIDDDHELDHRKPRIHPRFILPTPAELRSLFTRILTGREPLATLAPFIVLAEIVICLTIIAKVKCESSTAAVPIRI